jgi:hypothetical protein
MKRFIIPAVMVMAAMTFLVACKKQSVPADTTDTPPWTSSQAAAADSVEGQLRAQGKRWEKTAGDITAGAYVQDALEGRLNQPEGRGAVGKVVSVSTDANGQKVATVDFGRSYSVPISFPELLLVKIVSN